MPELSDADAFALPGPGGTPTPSAPPAPTTGLSDADAFALPGPLGKQGAPAQPSTMTQIAHNVQTGAYNVWPSILGTPQALSHLMDAGISKGLNYLGANSTPEGVDKYNVTARFAPSTEELIAKEAPLIDGLSKATGGNGYTPYVPQTGAGRAGQAVVTAAGAAMLDPAADVGAAKAAWNIFKNGVSGGAASVAQSLDPTNPFLAPAAAMLTHGGLSVSGKTTAATLENTARPFYAPTAAGEDAAGARLSGVDNTPGTGLANPSAADILGQQGNVGATTGAIGTGQSVPTAMEGLQDTLSARQAALDKARTDAAAPFYAKFRGELPTIPENMPRNVTSLPAFAPARDSAETDMLNGANAVNNPYGSPTTTFTHFNEAGDPQTRSGALTPDLLGRTARKLNIQAATARRTDSDSAAGLTAASSSVSNFLDKQYPNSYPAAQRAFADASRPLDVFDNPAVARAVDQNTNKVGTPLGYTQDPASLLNTVAKSANPGTVVSQFIEAAGGDPASVTSPIRQAIVGQLHDAGAINPATGEVNAKLLDQTVKPYMSTIGMYLPELADQFGSAKAAQATLDNMRTQKFLTDSIAGGDMRDDTGAVTGQSMAKWMRANQKDLEATQGGPGSPAMMRLQQIQKAVGQAPGGAADAFATEVLPSIVSDKIGGSENAILAVMGLHKIGDAIAGKKLAAYRGAYSTAIEKAAGDPSFAKKIVDQAATRPGYMSGAAIRKALGEYAGKAMRAGAIASGLPSTQQ